MATSTPWGLSDSIKKYAPGIIFYTTPGHGGFHISKKKLAQMHPALQKLAFPKKSWFEEDCAWSAVTMAFPEYFTQAEKELANRLMKTYYPVAYSEVTGIPIVSDG